MMVTQSNADEVQAYETVQFDTVLRHIKVRASVWAKAAVVAHMMNSSRSHFWLKRTISDENEVLPRHRVIIRKTF